jgi:hypothetical protein
MSAAALATLREQIGQPLPLAYHPLYRFYEGGSLTRRFRGLPERPDDWWSEDWVGSCTCANNTGPDGRAQGLSTVELRGAGAVTLQEIIEALPGEMVGARFAGQPALPRPGRTGARPGRPLPRAECGMTRPRHVTPRRYPDA